MPWSVAASLAVALLLTVTAVGAAVLAAAGRRTWVSAAPAVGTGVVAVAAVAADALGVAWGLLPVAAVTALCAGAAAVLHRWAPGWPALRRAADAPGVPGPATDGDAPRPTLRLATAGAVLAASLLTLVPLAAGMGRPDRVQNAWDALFHAVAVDRMRAGGGPGSVSDLASPDGNIAYPFAWHALTSLLPGGVDAVAAANLGAFLPTVVVAAAGTAALARAVLPATPWAGPVAALLTAAALGSPLSPALQPGLVANAFGLALVPGVLAHVVRPHRVAPAAVVPAALAALGIGLSHPGALLGLAVLAAPWVVARAVRWARTPGGEATQRRTLTLLVVLAAGVLAVNVVVSASSTAEAVAGTLVKEPVGLGEVARRLLTGDLGEWPVHPLVVVVLAVVGTLALLRRRDVVLVVAALLVVAAYAVAATQVPMLSVLTSLWYTETRRIAPLVGLPATLLAAHGLVVVVTWVGTAVRRWVPAGAARAAVAVCALALVAAAAVPGVRATHTLAVDTFAQEVADGPTPRVPYLTADEEAMVRRLAATLGPDDLVLGGSLTGAGHLGVLTGARVSQPYQTVPHPEDVQLVDHRLADLGRDPVVCAGVRRLGARYLYVDPAPLRASTWTQDYPTWFTEVPGPQAPVVDRGGTASLHSLAVCYEDGPAQP